MNEINKKRKTTKVDILLTIFGFLLIFVLMLLSMYGFNDSEEKRIAYQKETIKLFNDIKQYQVDLKNESKFNVGLNEFDFIQKSKAYFNPDLVSNINVQGDYVIMEANSQMLCFAINELIDGKEIDLRTYKKQYLGIINNQRKGDFGCQEYKEEPWYVIYIKK